jgi:hypothetical protein
MGVSGQLHAPVAFIRGEKPQYPTNVRLRGTPAGPQNFDQAQERQFLDCPGHNLFTTPIGFFWLQ